MLVFHTMIHSGIHSSVTTQSWHLTDDGAITVDDPSIFGRASAALMQDAADLCIQPIGYHKRQSDDEDENASVSSTFEWSSVQFYTSYALTKQRSLVQGMFTSTSVRDSPIELKPLSRTKPPLKTTRLVMDTGLEDGFIVEDDRISDAESDLKRSEPISTFAQRRREQVEAMSEDEWTVNYELSVAKLNEFDVSQVADVEQILEDARSSLHLNHDAESPACLQTLRDLGDGEMTVLQIEQLQEQIEKLRAVAPKIKTEDIDNGEDALNSNNAKLVLERVAIPTALSQHFYNDASSILRHIEDDMQHVTNAELPELVQLSRERLARNVAAELALASHVLRPAPIEENKPPVSQSQSQPWSLPLRFDAAGQSRATTPSIYFDASSQIQSPGLPTPSATSSGPRSTVTGSTHTSALSSQELTRLSRYTSFTKPAPSALPRRLRRVLTHWTPGTDPSTYDWQSATRSIANGIDEAEDEEMTEKERKRLQRATERHLRRQRREAEESQRQQLLNSQAPEIFSTSQPLSRPKAESQREYESQLAGSSQMQGMPASQILPGRHGGRPPIKKRKYGF
jgi:RNA polymerase I-specific transcription initiation factor RRN6